MKRFALMAMLLAMMGLNLGCGAGDTAPAEPEAKPAEPAEAPADPAAPAEDPA